MRGRARGGGLVDTIVVRSEDGLMLTSPSCAIFTLQLALDADIRSVTYYEVHLVSSVKISWHIHSAVNRERLSFITPATAHHRQQ